MKLKNELRNRMTGGEAPHEIFLGVHRDKHQCAEKWPTASEVASSVVTSLLL